MSNFLNKLYSIKVWRVLTVVFLTVAVLFGVILEVAMQNERVLNQLLKTSSYKVIDNSDGTEDSNYFPSDYTSSDAVTAYAKEVCEDAEAEGLVLMKNNGALPLSEGDKVSTVLQTSVKINYGSSGSGAIDATKYVDLKTALESVNLSVNSILWNFYKTDSNATSSTYEQGQAYNRTLGRSVYKVNALPWSLYSDEAKNSISSTGGTVLVVIGRLSGEGSDIDTQDSDGIDGSYLSLSTAEKEILEQLTTMKKNGAIDNIVVLLNTALAFQTAFLDDSDSSISVDACMWIGNVGITGINAVAKALVGKVNPSGKLSDTYVKDNFSSPAMASWTQSANGNFSSMYDGASVLESTSQKYFGVYTEGIYVGYRYYETRYEDIVLGAKDAGTFDYSSVVSYPFGHGLSYSTFDYSDYSVEVNEDGNYDVSVTVTNTSNVEGKEVVQVYLQKPYTDYDREMGIEKPSVELVGFKKTEILGATGTSTASETVTITVDKENFKTYDAYGYKTYILEDGDYYLAVGTSAHDALNNILAAKGKTSADGMTADGNEDLAKLISDITLDTTTYAVSSETEKAVTNKLNFCDINEYEGAGENKVTYVSRNNWSGTFPKELIKLTLTVAMENDLKSNKAIVDDESAKMPTYGASNGLTLAMLRENKYEDDIWELLLDQMTFAEQAKLITNAAYGSAGATSIALPEIVAEDGPTGVVDSEGNSSFPSEGIWASTFNIEIIQKVGDALAEDARAACIDEKNPNGITGMYLPGVNIHRTPFGGRAHEYFSEDPYLSGVAVEYEVKGIQNKGVIPYVKHFAFNDEEDNRSGVSIWLNEQSAREIYLKPFEYAVSPSHGNAHGVMSSFNRAGCIWTSASSELIQGILRDEFGFDGVVLTDMAGSNGAYYMTYLDGFMNGTDLFLDGSGSEQALDSYAKNATFANKVRDAVHRYLYVVSHYSAAMNGMTSSSKVVKAIPWWQALLIAFVVIFFVLSAISIVFMVLSYLKKRKNRNNFA